MNALNANDLKIGGVTAIETALQNEPEVAISVRGERRFVVMSTAQYEHLRECELEAAWLTSQADRAAGRVRSMTAAQHIADMRKQLQKPAGALIRGVQQERSPYQTGQADRADRADKAKKGRTANTKPAVKTTVKSPRQKSAQTKTR